MKLRIQHRTTYRYSQQVMLGPHRLMIRPREGHDIQIEQLAVEIKPAHRLRWIRDVFGNSIAVVHFMEPASELIVNSELVLRHFDANPFDFQIDPEAFQYPFLYDMATFLDLAGLMQIIYTADAPKVREWLNGFWHAGQTIDTMALLQHMNGTISRTFQYRVRHEPGVQTPAQTLEKNSGSCRDFATLFIEACRCLGLGARFVSGYLPSGGAVAADASTHAWAEVYLPGGGWKGFDPTLGLLTTSQHIPVAVSRHPENAMPISGSFIGPGSATLQVDVRVEEVLPAPLVAFSSQSQSSTPNGKQYT